MNTMTIERPDEHNFEIVDDSATFFAPAATDLIDGLIGQYRQQRANVVRLHDLMIGGELGNVAHYFIEGNAGDSRLHRSLYVDKLFGLDGAIGALNSAFWSKALALTDVYECMPQERKNAWNAQLRNPAGVKAQHRDYQRERAAAEGRTLSEWESEPLPDFEEETARSTIASLLHARTQFLAERVDGIFRALSGEHVTNAPEAFGKRMIVAHILNAYDTTDHERIGYLHDLRKVIARFMGREEPKHQGTTDALVTHARHHRGQWIECDGGALRLRVYKVGTAHLEVHPDMAWRLNQILAFLHPLAIPAQFRQRPKRKAKDVALLRKPLPFPVLDLISGMQEALEPSTNPRHEYQRAKLTRRFDRGDHDKHVLAEARAVIESIGGVPERKEHYEFFRFDYEPADVLREIVTSGCVPDTASHQFYPTPEIVAQAAADAAEIGDTHTVLEPSAGHGDLAAFLPKDRTHCVEISQLRCSVLRARGFATECADFLAWAPARPERYERIVMNPPFSEGRWRAHLEAAMGLVAHRGRLVAILPASARQSLMVSGQEWSLSWSEVFSNEFAGTSVSVVILTADRS